VDWVEASGKSLVEAKEAVLDLLGVAEDDAEFVVLSEPKAGLFGRMRGEARVQARVRPVAPPPKRGRRQRPERRRDGSDRPSGGGRGGKQHADRNGNGDSNGRKVESAQQSARSNGESGSDEHGSSGSGGSRNRRRQRPEAGGRQDAPGGGRSQTAGNAGNTDGADGHGDSKKEQRLGRGAPSNGAGRVPAESEDAMEETLTLEQQGETGQEFISGLIREFGLSADVGFRQVDDETVEVTATGNDLGILVGPRGATLTALQDLTRTYVQRQSVSRTDRILVDVGGYREKRSAALRRFTQGIVDDVKETGEERALEPMSAPDRKVVHDAVNEIEGVETRSEGEEPRRYIVIAPS
jgi:spoIIIJ-associated protein